MAGELCTTWCELLLGAFSRAFATSYGYIKMTMCQLDSKITSPFTASSMYCAGFEVYGKPMIRLLYPIYFIVSMLSSLVFRK